MSEITVGKIIIDFPDSHKHIAEGLKDKIVEELSDRHDSDEEELKNESKELRDYDFLRSEDEQ